MSGNLRTSFFWITIYNCVALIIAKMPALIGSGNVAQVAESFQILCGKLVGHNCPLLPRWEKGSLLARGTAKRKPRAGPDRRRGAAMRARKRTRGPPARPAAPGATEPEPRVKRQPSPHAHGIALATTGAGASCGNARLCSWNAPERTTNTYHLFPPSRLFP